MTSAIVSADRPLPRLSRRARRPDASRSCTTPRAPAPTGGAGLLLPPWGWSDVASYRARRDWADRLAAGGRPDPAAGPPGDRRQRRLRRRSRSPRRLDRRRDRRGRPGCRASRVSSGRRSSGSGSAASSPSARSTRGAAIDDLVLWSRAGPRPALRSRAAGLRRACRAPASASTAARAAGPSGRLARGQRVRPFRRHARRDRGDRRLGTPSRRRLAGADPRRGRHPRRPGPRCRPACLRRRGDRRLRSGLVGDDRASAAPRTTDRRLRDGGRLACRRPHGDTPPGGRRRCRHPGPPTHRHR